MDLKGTSFFHLHRFGQWFDQTLSSLLTRVMAWSRGVETLGSLRTRGVPYFYRTPHSVIRIGEDCSIWSSFRSNNIGSMCRSRICTQTPKARIEIEPRVGMSGVTITAHEQVTIGADTIIGAGTVITDSDWHCLTPDVVSRHNTLGKSAPVTIGRNVFIGTRCIILKGVTIGDHAVIGAGSVVSSDIPDRVIAAGNPCRIIKNL